MKLSDRACVPCEGGMPPLSLKEAETYLKELKGWEIVSGKLRRSLTFHNFKATMKFVNMVAELAEEEGHHPDMQISYDKATLELFTHAIGGLSQNDFILAAKIDNAMRGGDAYV